MARCGWATCLVAILLSGCGALGDRPALFGGSDKELVGSFRTTDYSVGETYRIRRDLLARKIPGNSWNPQYYLSGNDATEEIPASTGFLSFSSPDQASLPLGTRFKVTKIEPVKSTEPGSFPHIYGEVLDGSLKGKQVLLSTVSRERRFIDPEFVEPADTLSVAAVSPPKKR